MMQIPVWLRFALTAVVLTATYENISKKIIGHDGGERDRHPIAYAAVTFVTVAVYSTIVYLLVGYRAQDIHNLLDARILLILVANVICYTFAPAFYYRAMKKIPLSEAIILYAMTGIYALIIGVLIGTEQFQVARVVGGIAILISIGMLMIRRGKWRLDRGFYMMMGATLFYALAAITDSQLIAHNYFSIFFLEAVAFGVPGVILLLVDSGARDNSIKMLSRETYPTILVNAALFLASFTAIFNAYKYGGGASQVNLVLSTETILVVVFAAIFLGERSRFWLKCLAAALACIGVYLLR